MRAALLTIAACALLAGCYHPTIAEGVPCGTGDACPSGLVCDRGLCVSQPRPDDAAADDAAVDALVDARADAYVPQCGTTVLFTDNLDDTTASPTFSSGADPGMTVTEANGHVDFTFAASVAANAYGYYYSSATYTAEGLCAVVEVSQVPNASGASAYFKLASGTFEVEFFDSSGMLELRTKNPTIVTRKTLVLNLVAHRFWRLRQQGGTTYWDTAPDGVSYVEQTSVAGVFTPTTASIGFGAGAYAAVSNGGVARFETVAARGP